MARIADLLKSDLGKGVAIGVGIGTVGLGLAHVLRPFVKEALKGGILFVDKGREWGLEARDSFAEIVTGVRTELNEERSKAGVVGAASKDAEA